MMFYHHEMMFKEYQSFQYNGMLECNSLFDLPISLSAYQCFRLNLNVHSQDEVALRFVNYSIELDY